VDLDTIIRHGEKTATRLARKSYDGGFDFSVVMNRSTSPVNLAEIRYLDAGARAETFQG